MTAKEKRICINEFKPNCIHLKSSVIEFRDGFVDEQVYCELTREKCIKKIVKK